MQKTDKRLLWDSILEKKEFTEFDIETFKNGGANTRITQYDYKTHGLLFLKNILYQTASVFQVDQLALLRQIQNRHVGGGISIEYQGIDLDLDYLLALEEVLFLKTTLELVCSIMEIGAGYGRTCHSILSLFPNITEYRILDLPQMLDLSRAYLKKVSTPENYKKIKFISVGSEEYKEPVDLIINIDSMQEMDEATVLSYLEDINNHGTFFYSNNTVGKFDPVLCGWVESEGSRLAMQSGLLREKINIFCPNELAKAHKNFLKKFAPSPHWSAVHHSTVSPWSHYYQVLFKKNA